MSLSAENISKLADEVAPDNPNVGVMLPYAPVQLLLFDYPDGIEMPDCLVMTSGNISGAPICRDDADAVKELSRMCDMILSHNRLIRLRADDSVMDFFEDKPYMIRRSRGYAPLPFLMEMPCEGSVLAVGGELKNTFCVTRNHLFYPSPYVGDMEDLRTVRALEESVIRMADLLEAKPEIIACDLHPKYNTTDMAYRLAEELHGKLRETGGEEQALPVIQIQHHYAHITSCMAENNYFDPVIGVSFDGTGYGEDSTVWGGEFLIADLDGYTRPASISPFLQIGGDASAKEGWRIAVSMLYDICGDQEKTREVVEKLAFCSEQELKMQFMMADRNINAVRSTSAGRLFDAVSAILGVRKASTFEGEASTTLMFYAQRWEEEHASEKVELMDISVASGGVKEAYDDTGKAEDEKADRSMADSWTPNHILDTKSLVSWLTDRKLSGVSQDQLAWAFHRILADGIVKMCEVLREESGLQTVALSGGVYQNRLLLRMCKDNLESKGFHVLVHSMLPPNDGGICLGQAAVAMRKLEKMRAEARGDGYNQK